jgi:UDP-N-acetylglucosamine 3-dehydrogenase
MKIALLGTGFGQAHATVFAARPDVDVVVVFGRTPEKLAKFGDEFGFATTTDLDAAITDPSVDLVDICLPTELHATTAVRAMEAGKDVLVELPLATTMDDARRIVEVQRTTGRRAFVDMFSRFDPAVELLLTAARERPHGALKTLQIATRTALLWEGYRLGLDSIAMDVMHSSLDTIVAALGRPESMTTVGTDGEKDGSAAEVVLTYPGAVAQCSASSLMPRAYGLRGGYRAVFHDAVLESTWTAGFDGRPSTALTEYTEEGRRDIELPAVDAYAAVIDHAIACCQGRATSRIAPASVLDALELTLDVHSALTGQG